MKFPFEQDSGMFPTQELLKETRAIHGYEHPEGVGKDPLTYPMMAAIFWLNSSTQMQGHVKRLARFAGGSIPDGYLQPQDTAAEYVKGLSQNLSEEDATVLEEVARAIDLVVARDTRDTWFVEYLSQRPIFHGYFRERGIDVSHIRPAIES